MLRYDAWVFPDGETHLPQRMRKWNLRVDGRLTYQYPIYELSLKRCKARRTAVDVGAHIGLFSFWMVRDFAKLVAFEPVERHRQCWLANVPQRPQDELHACALGARPATIGITTPDPHSTGGSYVSGNGDIQLCPLDSFDLADVDFLKIDCEGFEAEVLKGGRETLMRCKPVVAVEQRAKFMPRYRHGPTDGVKFLRQLGARVVWTDLHDYVMEFP